MFKNILKSKWDTHLAFATLVFTLSVYVANFRYYLYNDITKAFNLMQMGGGGDKISLSVIFPVIIVLGIIGGTLMAFFLRRRITAYVTSTLTFVTSLLLILTLFINPYMFQLLIYNVNQQNIWVICTLVLMLMCLLNGIGLSVTIGTHILNIIGSNDTKEIIFGIASSILSIIPAFIIVGIEASFTAAVGTLAVILLLTSSYSLVIKRDALYTKSDKSLSLTIRLALPVIICLIIILTLVVGAVMTEQLISF